MGESNTNPNASIEAIAQHLANMLSLCKTLDASAKDRELIEWEIERQSKRLCRTIEHVKRSLNEGEGK